MSRKSCSVQPVLLSVGLRPGAPGTVPPAETVAAQSTPSSHPKPPGYPLAQGSAVFPLLMSSSDTTGFSVSAGCAGRSLNSHSAIASGNVDPDTGAPHSAVAAACTVDSFGAM